MAGIPADKLWIESPGGRYMLGRAHVDSGLMTLLAPGSSPSRRSILETICGRQ
jgi:hypothetical protein